MSIESDRYMAQIRKNRQSFLRSREMRGLNPFWWGIQGPGGLMEREEAWIDLGAFIFATSVIGGLVWAVVAWFA